MTNDSTRITSIGPSAITHGARGQHARKLLALATLAVAGLAGAGASHARDNVQWSVQIGGPIGVSVSNQPRYWGPAPVVVRAPVLVAPRPVYGPPVVYAPPVYHGHVGGGYRDADHDGIPNRYDRVYNPRWDRNGNGVADWRDDRRDDRRGHGDQRDDRRDDRRDWRDDRRGR